MSVKYFTRRSSLETDPEFVDAFARSWRDLELDYYILNLQEARHAETWKQLGEVQDLGFSCGTMRIFYFSFQGFELLDYDGNVFLAEPDEPCLQGKRVLILGLCRLTKRLHRLFDDRIVEFHGPDFSKEASSLEVTVHGAEFYDAKTSDGLFRRRLYWDGKRYKLEGVKTHNFSEFEEE